MANLQMFKTLPKGGLLILVLVASAFIVGGSLIYVGLNVPGDGTVVDTPVQTAGFSSSVSSFHFGSLGLANSSVEVAFTVTNVQPTTQTLHVYAVNGTDPEVELIITLTNDSPFSPTALTSGASINLKAHLEASVDATPGPITLVVRMD
jgi:hypothetical protein